MKELQGKIAIVTGASKGINKVKAQTPLDRRRRT